MKGEEGRVVIKVGHDVRGCNIYLSKIDQFFI